jgi:hypothetical protein
MKKTIIIFISFFLFGTFGVAPVSAVSTVDPNAEHIESYDVVMNINQDSSINVIETIAYSYGNQTKNGFSRFLPLKYQDLDGTNFEIKVSNITVTDENGNPYPFKTVKQKSEDKTKIELEIKIGDPNQNVTGTKKCVISYRMRGAIKYFSDHDQLFWNITGNRWPIYVKKPSVKVNLPKKVDRKEISKECFIGIHSATVNCIDRIEKKKDPDAYYSYKGVVAGEGMTLVFHFPKEIVHKPTSWQNFWEDLKTDRTLAIIVLSAAVLLIASIVLLIWKAKKIVRFFLKLFRKKESKKDQESVD